MRKHSLFLSLLVMFFAVFMTACENTSTKGASISGPNEGGLPPVQIPTLGFTYKHVDGLTYEFTGTLTNGKVEDYIYTWSFGDGSENVVGDNLTVTHTYASNIAPMVKLSAEPKDPSLGLVSPEPWQETVNFVDSSIQIGRIDYSNGQSGLEFIFQVSAVSNNGSDLTYRWNFGDESEEVETSESIVNHKYGKYNKTYPVTVTVSNGIESVPATLEVSTSALKAVVNVVNDTENTKSKTFTVDIMDENDNLIHGSSNSGEVNGLTNVSYNWNFGDGQTDNTTNRTISHIYENAESSNYTVTVDVTTDNYDGAISGTALTNVELGYSLPNLTASLSGVYGLTLNASAQGNGGTAYANKKVTYKFTFPDQTYKTIDVTHNDNGYVTEPATVSTELTKYYSDYPVNVEVIDNGVVIANGTIKAAKPTFDYALNITAGSSYFNKTFTATPKEGSFSLKDATFTWTFGDGETETNNYGSVNHTFINGGNYTVTVNINSSAIGDSGISVKAASTQLSLEATVTVNNFNCSTNGAEYDFLQYTCTVDASSNGGTLVYKWYVDNTVQNGQTGKSFTKKYDKYNKVYTVKAEISVQGNTSNPVVKTFELKTPAVWALMTGPNYLTPGQEGIYTVVPKVTHNGVTKDVPLQGANYTFYIKENGHTTNNNANSAWRRSFEPGADEYVGNTVNRTVYAKVTATNINGNAVTSSEQVTVINKPQASLADFQSAVVSCTPKNGVNFAKQQCKITLTVKNGSISTGNFNEYKAKITAQGVTKEVLFDYKALAAGASQASGIAEFDFNLPNGGDIVTGQPKSNSSNVTGYVYKGDNVNTRLNATSTTVNINLNVDYVLFPYTTGYEGQGGGTGYTFSTWTCNYGGIYDENVIPRKCGASSASGSGQTLKLGSFANSDGTLKGKTKFEWYVRINKEDGNNIPETKVQEFIVNAGSKPTDEQLKFNIAGVLRNKEFIGSAYNNTNNVFYLKITPADDNTAKPVRVWYNGSNKTNYGYRLQYITPILRNEHTNCAVRYEYTSPFFKINFLKIHLTSLDYRFDGASKYNSTDFITPSTQAYRPILRFQSDIIGISGWHNRYFNDYNGYGMAPITTDWTWGWNMYIPDWVQLEYKDGARGDSQVHLQNSSTKLTLLFKDMLKGSGSQLISNHYKPLYCSKTQYVHMGLN